MDIRIETASELPQEIATAAELRRLLRAYDLRGLEWTDRVIVRTGQPSHSHPVVTLNTRRTGDSLLATYLHEQLHWWLIDHDQAAAAIDATGATWPSTPSASDGGARSDHSTRLHLFVCFLEHRAMQLLTGPDRASDVLTTQIDAGLYPWVRRELREQQTALSTLCDRYELWPPRLREIRAE
ncbi:hypothetical protein [Flexivirga caeni]|uniref:Uncharacterized protein n=1 Tax=Flexivirga caeni TaxID=2294115 RepID=A0A3M9MKP4_9MICO|nr:hypothetical protein [Flexivirga caeni]RNI25238.1 hypothetical protein EFY87_00955 [Flexivirga caeni]